MMTQRKDILAKLREEFEESVLKPAIVEDPCLDLLPLRNQLDDSITIDTVQDLEYTTMCLQEALRI